MKTFILNRKIDDSGISGIGVVAEGVQFKGGMIALHWLSSTPSVNIYRTIEEMLSIHGHEGNTTIEFKS
jgi:hypothetical protein